MPDRPAAGIDELIVENLGTIERAHLEPGTGLVVFTGETGAGKTMLIEALRLLLGGQARRDVVGRAAAEATVQGRFTVGGDEVTAARRIGHQGRSRAYLDGMAAPVGALTHRLAGLVELTSQHDHILLGRPEHLREVIDAAAGTEGAEARAMYVAAWEEHRTLTTRRAELGGDRRAVAREIATSIHHVDDIVGAGFASGDDRELEVRASRLRHAGAIAADLDTVASALGDDGTERHLDEVVRALRRAAVHDPDLTPLLDQADMVAGLVGELRTDVARAASGLDDDPSLLNHTEERLARLAELRRRYGDSLDDVLAFAAAERARADELEALLAGAATLDAAVDAAGVALQEAARHLGEIRRRTAERVARDAMSHLVDLGFGDPVVEIVCSPAALGPDGGDRVELRFASDRSLGPGPVGRVASGGELSRLVLAIRLAGGGGSAPVAAFDEVDAGVGGAVALELGRKLADVSIGRQVLCVTHLPQVAAHADEHFLLERTDNATTVRRLDDDGRVAELSRMLAGLPESAVGRDHAAELLEVARSR